MLSGFSAQGGWGRQSSKPSGVVIKPWRSVHFFCHKYVWAKPLEGKEKPNLFYKIHKLYASNFISKKSQAMNHKGSPHRRAQPAEQKWSVICLSGKDQVLISCMEPLSRCSTTEGNSLPLDKSPSSSSLPSWCKSDKEWTHHFPRNEVF